MNNESKNFPDDEELVFKYNGLDQHEFFKSPLPKTTTEYIAVIDELSRFIKIDMSGEEFRTLYKKYISFSRLDHLDDLYQFVDMIAESQENAKIILEKLKEMKAKNILEIEIKTLKAEIETLQQTLEGSSSFCIPDLLNNSGKLNINIAKLDALERFKTLIGW